MHVSKCLYCGGADLRYSAHRSDGKKITRCENCGLLMVDSLSENTEKLYTEDYFEKKNETKNGYLNYLSSPAANVLGKFAFAALFFGENIVNHLDIGSADGSLMEIFVDRGHRSIGLEISKAAVDISVKKGLDVSLSNLSAIPARVGKLDIITAFDLLEHLDRPSIVLDEVREHLKDDGYFLFSTLAVTKNDPSEYWYNTSLEHYIYFNKENLEYILNEKFGKGSHSFIEIHMNGIPEFWGVVKKGKLTQKELKIIDHIQRNSFPEDPDQSYLLGLFYDQISKFDTALKIIKKNSNLWSEEKMFLEKFYYYYFQGKFEKAIEYADSQKVYIPASESIFWQAKSFAQNELYKVNVDAAAKGYTVQIVNLREEVFNLKQELYSMRNSRVLGRIIKTREYIGSNRKKISPHKLAHKIRVVGAPIVPSTARRSVKRAYKKTTQILRGRNLEPKLILTSNKPWPSDQPLITVVVPYYNRGDTITETLLSLEQQTYKNFSVIIVDDGSTDQNSIDQLRNIDTKGLNVEIIRQPNSGVAAARNAGISEAKGKYIICLDSDDILESSFIEKCTIALESNPEVDIATTYQDMFGVYDEIYKYNPYDPVTLIDNNTIITAAEFRKDAWINTGGYKSGIGYEDWEFWINLAEKGSWAKLIPEPLFKYRTSIQSRYVEDKDLHWNNIQRLKDIHPNYKSKVIKLIDSRKLVKKIVKPSTMMINLGNAANYQKFDRKASNILITIPWMAFGGAETLIYNFSREIKNDFNLTFMTGLKVEHDWEYKFREITPSIYHLANLVEDNLYIEFISNYISTRGIEILHIIHNGFTFDMLPELKKRHPHLKVIVTLFNDRVGYFDQSIQFREYIDVFTSDNNAVNDHYKLDLGTINKSVVIPNGINCYDEFNPNLFEKEEIRSELGLKPQDKAIFFVGRLSEEKNPDVFIEVASKIIIEDPSCKFFIIGDGAMRPSVEKRIKEINSDNIKYLGYQSDVAKFFAAADIFILPSSIEGFPLSILEAMAMEVAVIASDVGAVDEVLGYGKDGIVVTPGSVEEIVAEVKSLALDTERLQKIKASGRNTVVEKYSSKSLGSNYKKLYKQAIKRGSNGK